jgi:hypothetical protein
VREQRPEGELDPLLFGDQHQQKVSAGLHDAGGFKECLIDSLAIEVIDRICADDGVKDGIFEWELAHISGFDCGTLFHASGLQICQQSLLRTFRRVRIDEADLGSGLGLAIVRDLAELYGGSIALDHSPLGGLRVRISLPAS